jgi:hypothetical protein
MKAGLFLFSAPSFLTKVVSLYAFFPERKFQRPLANKKNLFYVSGGLHI